MAVLKVVLAGIAAATAVVGGVMAARSYRQASAIEGQVGEYNNVLAKRDAKIKEEEARGQLEINKLQAQSDAREFRDLQASTELALQAHGWMQGAGTPMLQLAYNADQFQEQLERNARKATMNERAMLESATQDRMRGDLERLTAQSRAAAYQTQATAALLGGVSGAARVAMAAPSIR